MSYTETLTIRGPGEYAGTAAAIGRALDPDVGGDKSFAPQEDGTILCVTPCTAEFKAQALAMLGDAALLHQAVAADYAERWPDLTPPTLAECESWLTAIDIESGGESVGTPTTTVI